MELLGGSERMVIFNLENENEEREEGKKERMQDITKEEIIWHLKKLKMAKAPGENEIENEADIYQKEKNGRSVLQIDRQNLMRGRHRRIGIKE